MKTAYVIRNPFSILFDKFTAYRDRKFEERNRRNEARMNMRMVKYACKHAYGDYFDKEDADDAISVATSAIDYYNEMLLCDRSNEEYGTANIFGKIAWFIALVFTELVGIMVLLAAEAAIFGTDVLYTPTVYWVVGINLLAVGIPMTILAINGKLLAPLLKLRIRKLRVWRDELREMYP